jgi:hypothetical protein
MWTDEKIENEFDRAPIDAFDQGTVVASSRLWELGDKLARGLGQRRETPGNEKWSGR